MKERLRIGVDPDSTSVGVSLVLPSTGVWRAAIVRPEDEKAPILQRAASLARQLHHAACGLSIDAAREGIMVPAERLHVETMHYQNRSRSAEVLMALSLIAGSAATAFSAYFAVRPVYQPADRWTNGIEKRIRHNRLLKKLGFDPMELGEDRARSFAADLLNVRDKDLSHVLDATDLALYQP